MLFASTELAARIECAESRLVRDGAAAVARRSDDVVVIEGGVGQEWRPGGETELWREAPPGEKKGGK